MAFLEARLRWSAGPFRLDVDLSAAEGWGCIFGRSGSGKSSTLRCIAGVTRPDEGRVVVGGETLFSSELGVDRPARDRGVGWVPAGGALFPHLTVRQNLVFGVGRVVHAAAAEGRRLRLTIDPVVDLLEIGSLLDRRPDEISTGERQRVAIGRALLSGPRVLLLDEPLAALDEALRLRIIRSIRRVKEESGLPGLYVTHSVGEVFALCDHVAVIDGGRLLAQGDPREVLARPRDLAVASLTGVENILSLEVLGHDVEAGVSRLALGEQALEVSRVEASVGESVHVGFRAEEVIVATEAPGPTSARNVLRGRVSEIRTETGEVYVTVDCGEPVLAKITPGSHRRLGLEGGSEVVLLLKAGSVHRIEP